MSGRVFDGREIEADYWDGHTDYKKIKETDEEYEARRGEFGDWLENQELPEDLRRRKQVDGEYESEEEINRQEGDNEDKEEENGNEEIVNEGENND